MKFAEYLQLCINHVENISNRSILFGIGELINEKQKIWIKSKLKQDTIFLLKMILENEKIEN